MRERTGLWPIEKKHNVYTNKSNEAPSKSKRYNLKQKHIGKGGKFKIKQE